MEEAQSKFTFPAEILPQNERTFAILKERKADEDQKREEAEKVNLLCFNAIQLKQMKDKEERDKKKREKDQLREKEKREKQAIDAA